MNDSSIWQRAAPAIGLASLMTGSILTGLLLGNWLDGVFGTKPVLTGALTLAGLISGSLVLARRAKTSFQPPDDSSPNPPP